MRILADINIVAQAVHSLRDDGHDVIHAAERMTDPGDDALLTEAVTQHRIFLTKDRDIGVLVYRDLRPHCGVLLVDDLGDAAAETILIQGVLAAHHGALLAGAFLRAGTGGVRESQA